MDGFNQRREALAALGFSIYAATVDSEEKTAELASSLDFPIAHSIPRSVGDAIGAWWDERRNHIQPSEFILARDGKLMTSTYSNSPLGRMDPGETLRLMKAILS